MIVGVIPAAGYATRLQPLDCSKEVYPVGGRPVMNHLIDRMRAAPCDELRVVTRREKTDVIANAREQGARVVVARPATLAASFLAGIEGLADDDIALLGFPDSLWEPADGYRRVLALLAQGFRVGLGLFEAQDLRRYEPVIVDDAGRVRALEFKPEHPSSSWLWGCAAAAVAVLQGLKGRQEPGDLFNELAQLGVVGAVPLSNSYLDMGTKEGLREALSGFSA
jgi:glucose-1-phosphate thymidylyltransferase